MEDHILQRFNRWQRPFFFCSSSNQALYDRKYQEMIPQFTKK